MIFKLWYRCLVHTITILFIMVLSIAITLGTIELINLIFGVEYWHIIELLIFLLINSIVLYKLLASAINVEIEYRNQTKPINYNEL